MASRCSTGNSARERMAAPSCGVSPGERSNQRRDSNSRAKSTVFLARLYNSAIQRSVVEPQASRPRPPSRPRPRSPHFRLRPRGREIARPATSWTDTQNAQAEQAVVGVEHEEHDVSEIERFEPALNPSPATARLDK